MIVKSMTIGVEDTWAAAARKKKSIQGGSTASIM